MKYPNFPRSFYAIGGLLLIGVLFFAQLLFSGECINATDILTQQYFWNVFIKENLFTDPCFQTWLPYVNGGTPSSGGLDLIFRPFMLLTLLLFPAHVAISYEMVAYLMLAGVGMFFYLREVGLSRLSAFLGGLFLMLNGELVTLINAGHVNKLGAIAPIALVFWALERALKQRTLRAFLVTAAALGFAFWQGHVQVSYYICIAVAIYAVIRALIIWRQERTFAPVLKLTLYSLVMVAVFLLMIAFQFLPMLSFAKVSDRAEGVDYEFATSWSLPPEEILTYFAPGLFGLRRLNTDDDEPSVEAVQYWGRAPFMQTSRYFGLIPVAFIIIALCGVRNKHILTLTLLALIVLAMGLGKYNPAYKLLYDHAPGFNQFRVPQMILFVFAFATSALAAFGAEWLFRDWTARKARQLRIGLLIGCIALLLTWLLILALPFLQTRLVEQFHDLFYLREADEELALARFQNIVNSLAWCSLFWSATLAAFGMRLAQQIRMRWLIAALLAVYLLDIRAFDEKFLDTVPIEDSGYVDENDAIRYMKENPGLYRVLPAIDQPLTYNVHNKFALHHLYSVSGYEAVGVQYYNDYMDNMALWTPLIDLLNIKYIILPKGATLDEQPVKIGDVIEPYKVVMDSDALLLENLNALPRAYPVHNAFIASSKDEAFEMLLHPQVDFREFVVLEERPTEQMAQENVPSSASHVEITHYQTRTITMKAAMATDGLIVLSEKYYAGWKAFIDGQPAKIYKANYTLQAIAAPKGEHDIVFRFEPTQARLGLWLTTITTLLLIAFLGTPAAIRQKQSAAWTRLHDVFRRFYLSKQTRRGLVLLAAAAHARQYLFNRSMAPDETSLALNILDRSFSQLLLPLDYNQSAPVGFLLIEKLFVTLGGDSEYVLRLFPFLCGIAALFLFARIADKLLPPAAIPVALGLFGFSGVSIIFSSTVKQYACDVFFTVLVLWSALRLRRSQTALKDVLIFTAIGGVAMCCSHPALFVFAGAGICVAASALRQKHWRACVRLLLPFGMLAGTLALMYLFLLKEYEGNRYLQEFWQGEFMPFPPVSLSALAWLVKTFFNAIEYQFTFPQSFFAVVSQLTTGESLLTPSAFLKWSYLYAMVALLFAAGVLAFARTSAFNLLLLLTPAALALFASGLRKYPFGNRLILFLFPVLCLFIGNGAAGMQAFFRRRSPFIATLLIGGVCVFYAASAAQSFVAPRKHEELRPMIQYMLAHRQPGDTIYVYYASQGVYAYYARRFGLTDTPHIAGIASRDDWQKYLDDLQQLHGKARVWLVFSHAYSEEAFFVSYLDTIGTRLDERHDQKASVYLYDLS